MLAGFLSFLVPGLGHLYIGQNNKSVKLLIVSFLFILIHSSDFTYSSSVYAYLLVNILDFIYTIIVIYLCVKELKLSLYVKLRKINKWYFYLLIYSFFIAINSIIKPSYIIYDINGSGMNPVLKKGDRFISKLTKKVNYGDIVVFEYPDDESLVYIQRIIAMPGDKIEIKDKRVILNGKELTLNKLNTDMKDNLDELYLSRDISIYEEHNNKRSYSIALDKAKFSSDNYHEISIPKDHYFVLGDNRNHSADSRYWGLVPKKNIIGVARYIYFTTNFKDFRKRFNKKLY